MSNQATEGKLRSCAIGKYGKVLLERQYGGVTLFRESIVEDNGDKAIGFIPAVDVYFSPSEIKELRDILNEWYPPNKEESNIVDQSGTSGVNDNKE